MSEATKRHQNPYPRGLGVGSVPVLFKLRNVQPNLVGASKKKEEAASATPQPIEPQSAVAANVPVSAAPMVNAPVVPSAKTSSPSTRTKSATLNRAYNTTIVVLVLALCFLVVRNSQNRKSETLASHTHAKPLDHSPTFVAANPKPVSNPGRLETPVLPPIGGELPDSPSLAHANKFDANQADAAKVDDADKVTLPPPMVSNSSPLELNPPAILPSNQPAETKVGEDTSRNSPIPATTVATAPASPNSSNKLPIAPTDSNTSATSPNNSTPGIIDTNVPLTTREMYSIFNRVHSSTEPQAPVSNATASRANVPTNPNMAPVSGPNTLPSAQVPYIPIQPANNPSPGMANAYENAPNGFAPNNNIVFSGQSYPPISKDYRPLTLSPYEQNALNNRTGSAGAPPSSPSTIRQPLPNSSNRYQGAVIQQPAIQQPGTTQQPYTPIGSDASSSFGSNSVGYPPGN